MSILSPARAVLVLVGALSLSLAQCGPPELGNTSHTTAGPLSSSDAWGALRQRPLELPTLVAGAPCPTAVATTPSPAFGPALGQGPIYAVIGDIGPAGFGEATPNKVLWIGLPSYAGPVLIRGRQLDGAQPVYLSAHRGGYGPVLWSVPSGSATAAFYGELDLLESQATGGPPGWREWPSYTYLSASGCYGWQVDGVGFQDLIVFTVH